MQSLPVRLRVAACVFLLCAAAPAAAARQAGGGAPSDGAPAGRAPAAAAKVDAPPTSAPVGVLPLVVPGKATVQQKAFARAFQEQLVAGLLAAGRDVVDLANEDEDVLVLRGGAAKRLEDLRWRAAEGGVEKLVVGTLVQRGKSQAIEFAVVQSTDGAALFNAVVARPAGLDAAWVEASVGALSPLLPAKAPTGAAPAPAPQPQAQTAPPPPPADAAPARAGGSALPLVAGVASASSVLFGLGAVGAGVALGAWAWSDSEAAVRLGTGTPERAALEGASIGKAVAADVSYAAGALLVIVGGAFGAVALLTPQE